MLFKAFGGGFTPIDYIELVTCRDGTDVKVFFEHRGGTPPSWWRVEINGQPSDQRPERLSFKAGDVIKVIHGGSGGSFMPALEDYFSEIRGALPRYKDMNYGSFARMCWNLKTVPSTLLFNMQGVKDFGCGRLFEESGVENVPKDIFLPLGNRVSSLNWTFSMCRNLKYLHPDTFAHFEHIGDMNYTFEKTALQNVTLRLNAKTFDTHDNEIGPIAPGVADGALKIIVKRGTAFAAGVKNSTNSNITIVEE